MSGVSLPTEGVTCAYSPALDVPACGIEPEVHLIVDTEEWGLVALFSCKAHCAFAITSGYVVRAHFFTAACATKCEIGELV